MVFMLYSWAMKRSQSMAIIDVNVEEKITINIIYISGVETFALGH